MKTKSLKKGGNQSVIVRFRVTTSLHERLKHLAQIEEMSLAGLIRRMGLDTLRKFPGSQD